jgi:AraC-like DNA-binding protein
MTLDTLSDVLRSVHLRGAVFYDVRHREAWAVQAPAARTLAPAVMPGSEHVLEYHVAAKGACWAAVVGEPPVRLEEGDVVVFPQGDAHVMSSAPGLKGGATDVDWVYATRSDPKPILTSTGIDFYGEALPLDVARWSIICGFIGCDLKPFNPLIATLPRLLHLPAERGGAWITAVIGQAVAESSQRRPGGEAMLERISEMIFVDAVRRYVETLPETSTGWLAGLRDRFVGRALALMHGAPGRDWSMEVLASEVALSRSALHERFVQLISMPPMQYLAQWRMQVAANLLRSSNANVATIALDVGYDSEAAFARAFKRLVGTPPAAWRRMQGATPSSEIAAA